MEQELARLSADLLTLAQKYRDDNDALKHRVYRMSVNCQNLLAAFDRYISGHYGGLAPKTLEGAREGLRLLWTDLNKELETK